MADNKEEIDRAKMEYEHVVSELARYDSDSQKLVSLVSLAVTTAFAVGVADQIEAIFPLVPILTLALAQYLLSNNYAYRVREQYVHRLEHILKQGGKSVPSLYHSQIRAYFLDLKWWEMALLPFSGAILYTVGILFLVSVYSLKRAGPFLAAKGVGWARVYFVACGVLLLYTLATSLWSAKKLASPKPRRSTTANPGPQPDGTAGAAPRG